MMKPLAIYIHGLDSDGADKAEILSEIFDVKVPDYSTNSQIALTYLDNFINDTIEATKETDIFLVGSSLGGFYADYLAEKWNLPCILLNPMIEPNLLRALIPSTSMTEENVEFLSNIKSDYISANNKLVLLGENDTLFPPHKTECKYNNTADVYIVAGSHRFEHLRENLSFIKTFIKLNL